MQVSKAPRKDCYAFDKLDGSNMRAKWTQKKKYHVFGKRKQLIDEFKAVPGMKGVAVADLYDGCLERDKEQLGDKVFTLVVM